jgi:MFS family permease
MFGSTVYLSQYFQIAKGMTPTHAGLMSVAMVGGLVISSLVIGRIISATGRWKRYLVGGMVLTLVGLFLLGSIDNTTSLVRVGLFMAVLGLGLGATMQNLVLAVQNTVDVRNIGAASSVVTFFRSMGGAAGVSVLGSIAASRISTRTTEGLQQLGVPAGQGGGGTLDVNGLPGPVQALIRGVYGDVIGDVFVIAAVISAIAVVAVVFIKEVALRTSNAIATPETQPEHLVPEEAAGELVGTQPVATGRHAAR